MINLHSLTKRLLPILLSLLLLIGAMPPAMADSSYDAVVSSDSMDVYAREAPHGYLGTLPQGTKVTVLATSGSAALISYRGYTGIARLSDLAAEATEPAETITVEATTSKPVVAVRDTRVYRQASTASRYIEIRAGTSMTLLGVKGSCAMVSRGGAVGYTLYSHLGEPGDAVETTEQPAETVEATPIITIETTMSTPVVTTQSTRVYQQPDTASRSVSVDKGFRLTLLGLSGSCAKVSRGSAVGYMLAEHLTIDDGSTETPEQTAERPSGNPFASGSNEAVIFSFLTGKMGYNRAAAMGVMANIKYESGYRPVIDGDRGTSFGICQWHLGRKTNLINWCGDNGYDYQTLEGQLHFLQYELTTRYPTVHSYLKRVEDSGEGAYDAGYYFCFNFEAPAARTSQSTARGKYARDTLYRM